MFLSRVLKVRYLAVLLLVLIVAASAYAFAAANMFPRAGRVTAKRRSVATLSRRHSCPGLDQPGQHHSLSRSPSLPPQALQAPVTVRAQLVKTGGAWFTCTADRLGRVVVPPASPTVTALLADNLRIIAAQ